MKLNSSANSLIELSLPERPPCDEGSVLHFKSCIFVYNFLCILWKVEL